MKNRKTSAIDPLAAEVSSLSRRFAERSLDSSYMDRTESREAYGVYFGEVSHSKGVALGEEILRRGDSSLFRKDHLRILDLGAGTGDFGLGVAESLLAAHPFSLSLHFVDRSKEALEAAVSGRGHSRLSLTVSQATLPKDRSYLSDGYDIVTMANCLAENESQLDGFADLLGRWLGRFFRGGSCSWSNRRTDGPPGPSSRWGTILSPDIFRFICLPPVQGGAPCPVRLSGTPRTGAMKIARRIFLRVF